MVRLRFVTMNEIFVLINSLQGLLCAHDAVAQKDYLPRLPEIPQEMDEDEETIKIVQLVKSTEPLVYRYVVGILSTIMLFL